MKLYIITVSFSQFSQTYYNSLVTVIFNSSLVIIRVRVKMIYFDKENHDIEETNTETFMCRSMSATNAYTELQMIRK